MDSSSASSPALSSDEGKVFVGGIGWDTTEEKLKDHFTHYGNVSHAMIMRDRFTAQPRGFAFIVFSDPSLIPTVLLQTHTIDGRTVEVKRAMSREQQQSLKSEKTGTGGNFGRFENLKTKKIFVGGLPSTITEDRFREYFQDYGNVTDVVIMYDPNTGRPRGFGFITFNTEDSVDGVLQKTFHELDGKLVEVKRALPKDASPGAASRGGYRGYGSFIPNARPTIRMGSNRYLQSPQQIAGGYPPYSGYGTSSFGYGVGNSGVGFSAYGGYGIGGHGSPNAGYTSPAGVYGIPGSPFTSFSKNQWHGQTTGFGSSGFSQPTSYGVSVPLRNASRSSPGGYTPSVRSPGANSPYANRGYNYNASYGGRETSHAFAGAVADNANAAHQSAGLNYKGATNGLNNSSSGHPDASWKPEA